MRRLGLPARTSRLARRLLGRDAADEAPLFDQPFYTAITEARLAHLASLELPVDGRSVLDVGCGVGRLSTFFEERGCDVTCIDGRQENIELLRRNYPTRRAVVVDVEGDELLEYGPCDVVFCYGLLYHLADPFAFVLRAAQICRELMIIETCTTDAEDPVVFLLRDVDDPTMSIRAVASRPSPAYVVTALRTAGFDHVYSPTTLPDHEDFRYQRLNDLAYERDGHNLRDVFVAARAPLDNPQLRPREASLPLPAWAR
jgi:SAM-dependent methyltransferase